VTAIILKDRQIKNFANNNNNWCEVGGAVEDDNERAVSNLLRITFIIRLFSYVLNYLKLKLLLLSLYDHVDE